MDFSNYAPLELAGLERIVTPSGCAGSYQYYSPPELIRLAGIISAG